MKLHAFYMFLINVHKSKFSAIQCNNNCIDFKSAFTYAAMSMHDVESNIK